MYINKSRYNWLRVIGYLGVHFFGFWGVLFITGLFIDVVDGESTPDAVYGVAVFLIGGWIITLILHYFTNKVRIYNNFFANDADGIIGARVIAKALGIPEKRVLFQMRVLLRMHLFKNCDMVREGDRTNFILSNSEVTAANKMRYRSVNCKNCGGENFIRDGFVYACQYCSGRIQ